MQRTSMLLPTIPKVLEYSWRRHLQSAARRSMVRDAMAAGGQAAVTVGFADLVGFTALSQQLDDHQLAAVVDRFETTAYDIVAEHGGRIVKMIGDEVMFEVDDPVVGVELGARARRRLPPRRLGVRRAGGDRLGSRPPPGGRPLRPDREPRQPHRGDRLRRRRRRRPVRSATRSKATSASPGSRCGRATSRTSVACSSTPCGGPTTPPRASPSGLGAGEARSSTA